MSNSRKINQLLDFCCQDVFEILDANRERAAAFLTENGPYADGFVDFANWTLDGNENLLKYCIDASSFSDLTVILMRTMAADGEFETEELEEAASLVSQSCHRYFWLDDYEKCDGGMTVEKFIKYYRQWAFGNARFVRNAFEVAMGNHANRLSTMSDLTRQALSTIEQDDIPFDLTRGNQGPFDVSKSKWFVKCPKCEKIRSVGLAFIGQLVTCSCGLKFRCPWWNLDEKTVDNLGGYQRHDRLEDFLGLDAELIDAGVAKSGGKD